MWDIFDIAKEGQVRGDQEVVIVAVLLEEVKSRSMEAAVAPSEMRARQLVLEQMRLK